MLADVCVEHNVRIDSDDPAVAIVSLNRLVLEAVLARAVEQIRNATANLDLQLQNVQVRAGALLAQEIRAAIRNLASDVNNSAPSAVSRNHSLQQCRSRWLIVSGLIVAAVFASGIWVGTLIP